MTGPKVFLNYLSFDANYVAITDPSQTNFIRITTAAKETGGDIAHERMYAQVVVKQAGYMYIYYSNEDATGNYEAYFDDFTVTHSKFKVYKAEDYYPFGLAMPVRRSFEGGDGNTFTDPYRYGYQGQYSEKDNLTGLNEFELRMYDARFGRWISPDPYGQFASPYIGMGNSPHTGIDPDGGLSSQSLIKAFLWAGIGGFTAGAISALAGDDLKTASKWAIAGALTGAGLSFVKFSSLKGMDLPVNIEKITLPAAKYASIQLPSSVLRPIPYVVLPSIRSIFTVLNSSPQLPARLGNRGTPWLDTALGEYNAGVGEIPLGSNSGPKVDVYLKYAGKRSGGYPWCASFGHWCLGQNGIEGNGPIGNDWLTFGQKLNQPALGAIVIFNKPDGHFGFIAGKYKDGSLVIIHGNWSDKVTLGNEYQPIPLNRIKSIRYPAGYTPNYNLPVIGVN